MIHIISDTHFFGNSYKEQIRGRVSNFDYTSLIITQWAKNVKDNDIVIHLGDIGGRWNKTRELLNSLPGRKILIRGNHDKRSVESYLEAFDEVHDTLELDGYIFTHIPIDMRKSQKINISGHLHATPRKDTLQYFNVMYVRNLKTFFDFSKNFIYTIHDWGWSPVQIDKFINTMNIHKFVN